MFHSVGSRQKTGACGASPVRVLVQRQGYSGKGEDSLGVDDTGDPNRGERCEEARAAEGLLSLVGTRDREEQARGQV